ncbi:hypothetical protein [Jiella sp. M17.18]|uniref:hypothetical protein n=1 Tax=Jiella sp. M17.18 TaxID=3234247 RepID=UPI0034DF6F5F
MRHSGEIIWSGKKKLSPAGGLLGQGVGGQSVQSCFGRSTTEENGNFFRLLDRSDSIIETAAAFDEHPDRFVDENERLSRAHGNF